MPEYSESGSPIYRHTESSSHELAGSDSSSIERIESHLEEFVGPLDKVFHELVSDFVHIDIHLIQPTAQHNFYTLVTTGMSDRPMAVPDGAEHLRYAELVLCLPRSWHLGQNAFRDEANYWPLRWLKLLARLPHQYNTWLGLAHTVPNGDPPQPFARNTKLCCALLSVPLLFGEEFNELTVNPGKTINFYSVIPIYREEMDLKMKDGGDTLFERLDAANVTELLDINRANVGKAR